MTKDEMDVPLEEKLKSELTEVVSNYQPEEVTPESERQLLQEVGQVAEVMNKLDKPWFFAGGTALDLHKYLHVDGKFLRNHTDHDVAVFSKDLPDIYDKFQDLGYDFTDRDKKILSREQVLNSDRNNAWVRKKGGIEKGSDVIEVIFLKQDTNGDVIFKGTHDYLNFPLDEYKEAFDSAVTIENTRIPLTPRPIQLTYKLFDGRVKDFEDLKTAIPTLTPEEKERFDRYLRQTGASFLVNPRSVDDPVKKVDSLDQLLTEDISWKAVKDRVLSGNMIRDLIENELPKHVDTSRKIYKIAKSAGSAERLEQELTSEFNTEVRGEDLEFIKKHVIDGEVTEDEFEQLAFEYRNTPQLLGDEIIFLMRGHKMWKAVPKHSNQ